MIKKGDTIKVLAGKDKGKTGKVLQVFPKEYKASVEGLNLLIKHLRPSRKGEKGQRIEFPAPLHISNLMVVCDKCNKATRTFLKIQKIDNKKNKKRFCKKCNKEV